LAGFVAAPPGVPSDTKQPNTEECKRSRLRYFGDADGKAVEKPVSFRVSETRICTGVVVVDEVMQAKVAPAEIDAIAIKIPIEIRRRDALARRMLD
jgi:hypothetical protein